MKTYTYVKQISNYYAYWDFGENENLNLDYDATAHGVWKWLRKENILDRVKKFVDPEWREEYLHLSIMDYFTMFEPEFKTTK